MLNFKERDIESGDMLYGERIQLARIFSDGQSTDFDKIRETIKLLHDLEVGPKEAAELQPYVERIIRAFNDWLEREQKECSVQPTQDQSAAGFQILADELGDMGNVVQIAEQRGWTFEQVLKLPYTEVFTIWKVSAANARFEQRYMALMERKSNKHGYNS